MSASIPTINVEYWKVHPDFIEALGKDGKTYNFPYSEYRHLNNDLWIPGVVHLHKD